MSTPFVSVVTPFHNTAAWLAEAIESVLRQTHANFEYLLLDNASTDGGGEIAASYARRDPRIRLLKTDRLLTQVQNYNYGLSQISPAAKYCKIVQADDWLYPQFLSASIELAETRDDLILVSSFAEELTGVIPTGVHPEEKVMTGRDACRIFFLRGRYPFGSPNNQLWRAAVVRGRKEFYDEAMNPLEDADVCFEVLDGYSFGFVHQVHSFTRRQEQSIFAGLNRMGWNEAQRLATLRRWGRRYLTDEEYARLHELWWPAYRAVLVEGRARRAGEEFVRFHRTMIAAGNMEDAARNLFFPLLGWYWDRIGNPKRSCENALRRVATSLGLRRKP